VRRNRLAVAATVILAALLVSFATSIAVQARRIARERDRANAEANRANVEATTAKQVSEFLTGLFRVSDPSEARGNRLTAREILDNGSRRIQRELTSQPAVQARLMYVMGNVYLNLGLYREAEALHRQALNTRRRALGHDAADTLVSLNGLAVVLANDGRLLEAEPLFREALAGERRVFGTDHPDTLNTTSNVGALLTLQGKYAEAEPYVRDALEIRRRTLGNDAADTLSSMNNLSILLDSEGKFEEAEWYARDAFERSRRAQGDDHPLTVEFAVTVATVVQNKGRLLDAEALFRQVLQSRRRVLGPDHPKTLQASGYLGETLLNKGDVNEAAMFFPEDVAPSDQAEKRRYLMTLARLRNAQRRFGDAERLGRQCLEMTRQKELFRPDRLGSAMSVLGESLAGQKRFAEAEPLLIDGYAHLVEAAAATALERLTALRRIVDSYERWGRLDKAVSWRARLPTDTVARQ
jgi:tetratricopeptide (TPR) repeat protein